MKRSGRVGYIRKPKQERQRIITKNENNALEEYKTQRRYDRIAISILSNAYVLWVGVMLSFMDFSIPIKLIVALITIFIIEFTKGVVSHAHRKGL
jgi:hypothetical protein